MRKLLLAIRLAAVISCASSNSHPIQQKAELPVVYLQIPSPPVPKTTQELLQFGFFMYENRQIGQAARAFARAISSGELNDRGRTLVYYYLGVCYRIMGDTDQAAENFFFFSIVGQDVLEDDVGFSQSIDLVTKVEEARRFVSDLWTERNAN